MPRCLSVNCELMLMKSNNSDPECLALVEKLEAEIKARNKAKMETGS